MNESTGDLSPNQGQAGDLSPDQGNTGNHGHNVGRSYDPNDPAIRKLIDAEAAKVRRHYEGREEEKLSEAKKAAEEAAEREAQRRNLQIRNEAARRSRLLNKENQQLRQELEALKAAQTEGNSQEIAKAKKRVERAEKKVEKAEEQSSKVPPQARTTPGVKGPSIDIDSYLEAQKSMAPEARRYRAEMVRKYGQQAIHDAIRARAGGA